MRVVEGEEGRYNFKMITLKGRQGVAFLHWRMVLKTERCSMLWLLMLSLWHPNDPWSGSQHKWVSGVNALITQKCLHKYSSLLLMTHGEFKPCAHTPWHQQAGSKYVCTMIMHAVNILGQVFRFEIWHWQPPVHLLSFDVQVSRYFNVRTGAQSFSPLSKED